MKKTRITLFSLILSIACMLTGCSDTPSEVKEEIENYKNAETVEDAETTMLPFADAIGKAKGFKEENDTNITVENVILPETTKMPTYDVKFYNEKGRDVFTKLQSEPLFRNNGGGKTVDTPGDIDTWLADKEYCFTSFAEPKGINYYLNESDIKVTDYGMYYGNIMRTGDTGCLVLFNDEEITGVSSHSKYSAEKRVLTDFANNTDKYKLYDGNIKTVADITEFAEEFCNKHLAETENNLFKYQVNYLDVREIENDKFGFFVTLCRKDKYGNLFDGTQSYPYTYDEFKDRNALINSYIHLWITSTEYITEFERYYTFDMTEKSNNENIVTIESAADILSNKLAQGKSYKFDTAELKYVFEVTQSDYIDAAREYSESKEDDNDFLGACYCGESIYAYGDYEITAVPYWVFTNIQAQGADSNCGGIYMVNALDGNFRIENVDDSGKIIMPY